MDLLISYLSGLVHSPCSSTNTLCSFLFYFSQHEAEAYLVFTSLILPKNRGWVATSGFPYFITVYNFLKSIELYSCLSIPFQILNLNDESIPIGANTRLQ